MKNWIRSVSWAFLFPMLVSAVGCSQAIQTNVPTDGRPIILSKSLGSWEWYVDSVAAEHKQTAGGPANGRLRADFIGTGTNHMWVRWVDNNGDHTVDLIVGSEVPMVHTNDHLRSKRTLEGFVWWLNDGGLVPGPVVDGKVPDEFIGMEPDTMGLPPGVPHDAQVMEIRWIPDVRQER